MLSAKPALPRTPAEVLENWGRLLEHGAAMVHILTGDYDTAIGELEYLLSVPSLVTTAKLPSAHLSLDAFQYPAHPDPADSRLTSKFGLAGESSVSEHLAKRVVPGAQSNRSLVFPANFE